MNKGIVRPATGLNLREKPNGEKIAVLPAKTEIEILEEVHFLRVKTVDGMTGYVHGDYIEELPSANNIAFNNVALGDTIVAEFPSPTLPCAGESMLYLSIPLALFRRYFSMGWKRENS